MWSIKGRVSVEGGIGVDKVPESIIGVFAHRPRPVAVLLVPHCLPLPSPQYALYRHRTSSLVCGQGCWAGTADWCEGSKECSLDVGEVERSNDGRREEVDDDELGLWVRDGRVKVGRLGASEVIVGPKV